MEITTIMRNHFLLWHLWWLNQVEFDYRLFSFYWIFIISSWIFWKV